MNEKHIQRKIAVRKGLRSVGIFKEKLQRATAKESNWMKALRAEINNGRRTSRQ